MNIQAEKIELLKLLLDTNNPKIIQLIKQIFEQEKNADFWDELRLNNNQKSKRQLLKFKMERLLITIHLWQTIDNNEQKG